VTYSAPVLGGDLYRSFAIEWVGEHGPFDVMTTTRTGNSANLVYNPLTRDGGARLNREFTLYGATSGEAYFRGIAGERFCVRNSGAAAVVEGVGDHGCEYMTGGVVTVLGKTGLNFGAGMTGGFAYVLDLDGDFFDRCNHELIDMHRISSEQTENHRINLMSIIKTHVAKTGSQWGQTILDDFEHYVRKFYLVKPKAANITSLLKTTMADPQ